MKLIADMIDKANKARELLDTECLDEASRVLYEIEVMFDELPGAIEDWAHMLLEESSHFSEARAWIHKDKLRALNEVEQGLEKLEQVNERAKEYDVAPESEEDLDD